MMSEKEHGILKGSTFPSLWEVSNSNAITKQVLLTQNQQSYSNMIYTVIDTKLPESMKRHQGQRMAEYLLM